MKELLTRIKNDPELKSKVVKGGIFFGLFIIGVIIFAFYQSSQPEQNVIVEKQNVIAGRMIPSDTTAISAEKTDYYNKAISDSMTILQTSNATALGGSVVQKNIDAEDNNAMLNTYMTNRQASIQKMQNSGSKPIASGRRNYNPNGNSSDWTTEKTSVTGTNVVSDVPLISTPNYRRNYNPDNPTGSLTNNIEQQTPETTNSPKQLTKEERLQNAISQKYNTNSNSSQNISVVAQIYNTQKINGSNTSVRIVLLEKLYVNNTTIGTDAFIYGVANVGQNSLNITIPNISYKGKNYPLNLVVYDYRTGEQGIPIKTENIVGAIGREAETQAQQEAGKLGRIGSVLTSVLGSRNKSVSIQLNDGHKIYLKSK